MNSSSVIDLDSLQDPGDVKKDNFGVWKHSGSHDIKFESRTTEDGGVEIGKGMFSSGGGWECFALRRLHSTHPSNPENACIHHRYNDTAHIYQHDAYFCDILVHVLCKHDCAFMYMCGRLVVREGKFACNIWCVYTCMETPSLCSTDHFLAQDGERV